MGEKTKKSVIQQMPALEKLNFVVRYNAQNILLDGKSPKYQQRFTGWAKNVHGEHLDNLRDALLSSIAQVSVTGQPTFLFKGVDTERLRGNAEGVIAVSEFIRVYASDSDPETDMTDEEMYNEIMKQT